MTPSVDEIAAAALLERPDLSDALGGPWGAGVRWDVICMDPPWPENGGGQVKRGADRHYPTQRIADIPGIILDSGVWRPAPNALLWMWTTETFLEDAFGIIARLGFRKCAGFVWAKAEVTSVEGETPLFRPAARQGLGQWSRVEHEHLLLARRGDVRVPDPPHRRRSVIYAPRGAHSAKPDEAWGLIEDTIEGSFGAARLPSLHLLEMFSRSRRNGWSAWGHVDGAPEAILQRAPS